MIERKGRNSKSYIDEIGVDGCNDNTRNSEGRKCHQHHIFFSMNMIVYGREENDTLWY